MDSPVLKAIKMRRSIVRFETKPVDEEKITMIMEAARWAPSWLNTQPWRFLRIEKQETKNQLAENVPTIFRIGLTEAPISIVVCVDTKEDPYHFVEDAAAAVQNMALAAQSVGVGTSWIGLYDRENNKNSAEEKIRSIVNAPKHYRAIAIVPIGLPKQAPEKTRKELSKLVFKEKF